MLKKKVILSQVSSKAAVLLATDGLVRRTNVAEDLKHLATTRYYNLIVGRMSACSRI